MTLVDLSKLEQNRLEGTIHRVTLYQRFDISVNFHWNVKYGNQRRKWNKVREMNVEKFVWLLQLINNDFHTTFNFHNDIQQWRKNCKVQYWMQLRNWKENEV